MTTLAVTATSRGAASVTQFRRRISGPLTVLAVGSLPFLLLELERDALQPTERLMVDAINVLVLVAFAVDYVLGIAVSSNRRDFVRTEWLGLVIIISQALALMPAFAGLGVLRALRAGRLARVIVVLLRAVALGGMAASRGRQLLREQGGRLAFGIASITWLSSAAAFTVVEDNVGERVHSFADALWWSAATITTVGYGDIYPTTPVGRLIGGFTMVVGISTFALVTAKVAQFLVRDEPAIER
jgi:voltage-gated potassium channel